MGQGQQKFALVEDADNPTQSAQIAHAPVTKGTQKPERNFKHTKASLNYISQKPERGADLSK
jgi:hypothetical protein